MARADTAGRLAVLNPEPGPLNSLKPGSNELKPSSLH